MHVSLGDSSDSIFITYDPNIVPEIGGGVPYVAGQTQLPASLPPCSSITAPVGFVGPVQCDDTWGPVNYSSQGSTPAASALTSLTSTPAAASNPNMPIYLALAGLGALILIGGHR